MMDISDRLIRESVEMCCESYLEYLDRKYSNESEHIFSLTFSDSIERNIKKLQLRKKMKKRLIRISEFVAVVFLFLLFTGMVLTVSVEAYRMQFISFIEQITDVSTTYEYSFKNDSDIEVDLTKINYSYIPNSYDLSQECFEENYYFAFFTDEQGHDFSVELTIISPSSTGFISIDTENSMISELEIHSNPAVINIKGDEVQLLWSEKNVLCQMAGNIEKDDIIRIAEGLIYNNER